MDTTEFPSGRSPRRELQLQGPRPTPLKVRKDSHKIRKPPVAQQPQQLPPRPPVIIYTVSPKIIHANPNEFMSLVQRLTGTNSTSSTSCSSSVFQENFNNGAISPAARFASIEKTKPPEGRKLPKAFNGMEMVEGINISTEIDSTCSQFQGILSPNPASLPTIPSKYFSPSSDINPLNFFYDLSPILHSNKNYIESSLIPSPTFVSPYMPSPNTLDLFHSLFDL